MKVEQNVIFIFSILIFSIGSAPPPIPNPIYQIIPETPALTTKKNNPHLSQRKRLDDTIPSLPIQNSTATITYQEDYLTIDHKLVLIPQNLPEYNCFSNWRFTVSGDKTLSNITVSCEITNDSSEKTCTASYAKEASQITFLFEGNICNEDTLMVKYKYSEMKTTKEILFTQEYVVVPMFSNSNFCDYKFIIPDGYVNLGLKNNTLTKQSDTTYTFYGQCPTESQTDIIRYSPEKVSWNADFEISLEYSPK